MKVVCILFAKKFKNLIIKVKNSYLLTLTPMMLIYYWTDFWKSWDNGQQAVWAWAIIEVSIMFKKVIMDDSAIDSWEMMCAVIK